MLHRVRCCVFSLPVEGAGPCAIYARVRVLYVCVCVPTKDKLWPCIVCMCVCAVHADRDGGLNNSPRKSHTMI